MPLVVKLIDRQLIRILAMHYIPGETIAKMGVPFTIVSYNQSSPSPYHVEQRPAHNPTTNERSHDRGFRARQRK